MPKVDKCEMRGVRTRFYKSGRVGLTFIFGREDWTRLEYLFEQIGIPPEDMFYDAVIKGLEWHGWRNRDHDQSSDLFGERSERRAASNIIPFPTPSQPPYCDDLDDDVPF